MYGRSSMVHIHTSYSHFYFKPESRGRRASYQKEDTAESDTGYQVYSYTVPVLNPCATLPTTVTSSKLNPALKLAAKLVVKLVVPYMSLPTGAQYFLSGVMQGKNASGSGVAGTVSQDYRKEMRDVIIAADPGAKIVEPWDLVGAIVSELYPVATPQHELFQDDEHVKKAFGTCIKAAAGADVVVSYLPEASMGSAVEIYAAMEAGKRILVVAPGSMAGNWVVRSYADNIFASMDELGAWLRSNVQQP